MKKIRLNFRHVLLHVRNIKILKCVFQYRNLIKFDLSDFGSPIFNVILLNFNTLNKIYIEGA